MRPATTRKNGSFCSPPWQGQAVVFFAFYFLVCLKPLPETQGASIRSAFPVMLGKFLDRRGDWDGNRNDDSKTYWYKTKKNPSQTVTRIAEVEDTYVHMNVDVHMDVNGKDRFPLSSPVWFQKPQQQDPQQENSVSNPDHSSPKHQRFSFLALLLTTGATGGMGENRSFWGRNLRKILPTTSLPPTNPRVLAAAGTAALVIHRANSLYHSEAVRRATAFWRRCGPMVAHYKFTKWWLRASKAPLERRDAVYQKLHDRYAPTAYGVALDLKGLYVKLIQVASSRPDFVPKQFLELFVQAQDSLPQWPIQDVKTIIDETLRQLNEDNLSPNDPTYYSYETLFEDIDENALGSASIGQCHKARIKGKYARELLCDTDGDTFAAEDASPLDVAVKVMHPGSEERFRHDFQVFRWLCKVALKGWEPILDECYRQIMSEFDYRKEAESLAKIRTNILQSPFSKSIRVPKPVVGLCGKELLVMELLDGAKLSDSLEGDLAEILGDEKSKQLLERKRLELILGPDKMKTLESSSPSSSAVSSPSSLSPSATANEESMEGGEEENDDEFASTKLIGGITEASLLKDCGWKTKIQLLRLYKRAQSTIDLLVDVQGYQMLRDGIFQGDPHPGNILELRASRKKGGIMLGKRSPLLGLIDYGQTKAISDRERLGVARVILALGEGGSDTEFSLDAAFTNTARVERIADAMRDLGFVTKNDDSGVLAQYAGLFFDSDEIGKRLYDCPTPQTYFKLLTEMDPLVTVPDVAVFVARCGFLLRGMGTMLGKHIKTSKRWSVYAKQALDEYEQGE